MDTITINGAAIGAAQISTLVKLQEDNTAWTFIDALSEIAEYIITTYDEDYDLERMLVWQKVIMRLKKGLRALAEES